MTPHRQQPRHALSGWRGAFTCQTETSADTGTASFLDAKCQYQNVTRGELN